MARYWILNIRHKFYSLVPWYGFSARTAWWMIKQKTRCRGSTLQKAHPISEFILKWWTMHYFLPPALQLWSVRPFSISTLSLNNIFRCHNLFKAVALLQRYWTGVDTIDIAGVCYNGMYLHNYIDAKQLTLAVSERHQRILVFITKNLLWHLACNQNWVQQLFHLQVCHFKFKG